MENNNAIDILRDDHSAKTENRRHIAALSALGLADFSIISLYQMGYIKYLPDVPYKVFDSDKVNASKEAVMMGLPDGVISLGMYAGSMFLATAASSKPKYSKWLDLALGGIVLGQAVGAAMYLYKMAAVEKKACLYCITGAVINFASLKPALALFNGR
jgi:uncharacterized membrane protein